MTLEKALAGLCRYLEQDEVGVAVSGGGDSVALLCLLSDALAGSHTRIVVYSVDHGLRPEAGDEVRFVSELAARLGCEHRALSWRWSGQGNSSAAARAGRYDAIADAARQDGVETVLLGHTKDDQAETVLMALARSAGVDGLAGMQSTKLDRGIAWHRPLLEVTRRQLRDYLLSIGQEWVDDPSNDSDAYERVRMRKAAGVLAELGITSDALSDVAINMQSARHALEEAVARVVRDCCDVIGGAVRIEFDAFAASDFEIQRRVLAKCLRFVAPSGSAPRRGALLDALSGLTERRDSSLSGCLILFKKDHIWVVREPNAVKDLVVSSGTSWDGKWRLSGPTIDSDAVIRALGEDGLKACENWRDTGLPRPALLSSPSIWRKDRLIAAPIVGYGGEWSAELLLGAEDFLS